jgi:GTP diphosphokinase / guanosine-3',5'-bis(diphosphate) 3'-diphosphatase
LHTKLLSGQTVKIITAPSASPKPQWLEIVITAKARTAIRHHLKTQSHSDLVAIGHRMLDRSLNSLGGTLDSVQQSALDTALAELKVKSLEDLLADVGAGSRTPEVVARQLMIGVMAAAEQARMEVVLISGNERGAVTFASCCHPIPGDDIFGYLSPGRGLMVHRVDCHNASDLKRSQDRYMSVAWDHSVQGDFLVLLRIEVNDQTGVLARVTATFAESRINIQDFNRTTSDGENAVLEFTVQVKSNLHLDALIKRMLSVDVVQRVVRVG